ncbi:biorientation of chromosomes in cell division protein 1-like 1 isoform X2 [Aphis craccivora]|uniref:Biorientation of chromosomes in cell division protein 1-like 1 isoform X2 n=1 Tax=Aphis craccivora TaxID=307492 RepID=A0A6G0Y3P5_APHCR|nr:biorientation of chromosomes in cell division protein 1-like 1 isoform X2 [Aphis craccivora]
MEYPTYQNWKQRIESNVHKFLSKVNYTPELNKNTIRERLRKHLLDGSPLIVKYLHYIISSGMQNSIVSKRETQDIEEGADRILTQVLAPRTLSMFEPKIAIAVDEYLGIKNEAPPIELNGLKESGKNLINVSDIENSTVFNSKIGKRLRRHGADNIACDKAQKDDTEDLRVELKEKSSSLCKEPKSLNGNQSDGENDTGECLKQKISQHKTKIPTSDKSKSSSSNHKSNKKDNICKEVVDKSKDIIEKSKDINNKANDIVNKPKDIGTKSNEFIDNPKEVINISKDVIDKPKEVINKPKDVIDKSKDFSKAKDIFEKSKDISKPKDIIDKSKDIINKTKDMVDKSKDKLFLSKNSNSNTSSHKSNRTDTKRTKRSVEEKKKSSSLCKEPKLLNGNRSDDESNAGGSSKEKSTIYKNKSSSTDKTKSSSSNHKSSRKDNTSTDVVDKSKDKSLSKNSTSTDVDKSKHKSSSSKNSNKSKDKSLSKHSTSTDVDKSKHKSSSSKNSNKSKDKSLSKNSHSTEVNKSKDKSLSKNSYSADVEKSKNKKYSSHKSNRNDSKRLKLSQPENKLPINNERIEESKSEKQEESEWNDIRSSSITNDEQDAANVLLSMSTISYESSHSEIITENILFIENSPPITETLKTTKIENVLEMKENKLEVTENELNIKENIDQTKTLQSSYNNDIKENSELKPINSEKSQLSKNSLKAVPIISSHMFEKECSVNLERYTCKNINIQSCPPYNVEITKEHQNSDEIAMDEKEFKTLNVKVNLDPNENDKTNECNSNAILKVPKLKIKLLPNQIDSINKCKRKKHHKDKESKKLKLSKKLDIPSEDSVSTNIMCEQLDQKFNNNTEVKMNDSATTLSKQTSCKEIEYNSLEVLDNEKSHCSFKGFSEAETIPCKNYKILKNVIKALQAKIHKHDVINDGFKGFTNVETHPCKHRDIVYAELTKLKDRISSTDSDFIGFSTEQTQMSNGHKYVIQQLELAKKQLGSNRIQNGKVFNEVVTAYLYESHNDSDAISRAIYSKSINDDKKDCTTENNNNHKHDNWVVEQEMKYKLLPVKVALERLERMEYGCSSSKHVSDSSHVPI